MSDPIQPALEHAALTNGATRELAAVCADYLIVIVALIAVATLVVAFVRRNPRLTWAYLLRMVALGVLAYAASIVLAGLVIDTRPYIVTHTAPLVPVAHDNGFPSDHVLLASFFTFAVALLNRRVAALCALLTLAILLGRMAIGAHHVEDVVGSIGVVTVVGLVVCLVPLPRALSRPLRTRPTSPASEVPTAPSETTFP